MLPPSNLVTSPGSTGMMIPYPRTSMTSVTKMKPRAGLRGPDRCIPAILHRTGRFGKPKCGFLLERREQLVHVHRDLGSRLDIEDASRALHGGAGVSLHVRARQV